MGSTPTRLRQIDFGFPILDFGFEPDDEAEFKKRTKDMALRVIKVVQSLPKNVVAEILGKQQLRSGTSIGANYRAVCRAKSNADIINKLTIVEEEADESMFWIELMTDSGIVAERR